MINMRLWFVVLAFAAVGTSFAEVKSIQVRSLDGKPVTLGAGGDKPELVMILATRCPVSNAYNDRMKALAKEYGEKVKVVGVNPNETESDEEVAHHAKDNEFTFPIYRDPGMKLSDGWCAKVTPHVYLFDKAGKLVYSGRIDDNQEEQKVKSNDLRNAIDKLLSGKLVTVSETHPFGCSIKRYKKK